jgi:hypothetical protein
METVSTPVVEREEKTAGELKRGEWVGLWWPSKVLCAERYSERSKERVAVLVHDPHYLRPELFFFDADFRVSMAALEEIPEDPMASGRDITGDEPIEMPAGVDGYAQTGR